MDGWRNLENLDYGINNRWASKFEVLPYDDAIIDCSSTNVPPSLSLCLNYILVPVAKRERAQAVAMDASALIG